MGILLGFYELLADMFMAYIFLLAENAFEFFPILTG